MFSKAKLSTGLCEIGTHHKIVLIDCFLQKGPSLGTVNCETSRVFVDSSNANVQVEYILGFGAAVVIVLTIIIVLILYLILQCKQKRRERQLR